LANKRPTTFLNANALWGQVVARTLRNLGLRHAVVSPGSRSTPLAASLASQEGISLTVALDERAGAFHALGIAKSTRRPVVLLCTSGTAAANYLPAVVEARLSSIPLLVLTADRPPEMRECRSGQTIRQVGIFGSYPVWEAETAVPDGDMARLRHARQTFVDAWQRSQGPLAGPVHLNLPFRDPLPHEVKDPSFRSPRRFDLGVFCDVPSSSVLRPSVQPVDLLPLPKAGARGLIIVGPHAPADRDDFALAVRELAGLTGWPVLVDGAGTLRGDLAGQPCLVTAYDRILRNPSQARSLRPESVIRLGDLPVSKVLRQWLAGLDIPTVLLGAPSENTDPTHARWTRVDAALVSGGIGSATASSPWQKTWAKAEARAARRLDAIAAVNWSFEGRVIPLLEEALGADDRLFVASSMPIRDLESFWRPSGPGPEILANRGANGIDGTVASALGAAQDGRRTVLLCGDLAFLHDGNALLLANGFRGRLTVVVVNNAGGGIFNHLPVAASPLFELLWGTEQRADIGKLCGAFAVTHVAIRDWSHLRRELALDRLGVRVLEVRCDREKDSAHRLKSFQS
jgi:2-succinyl-5-enolpyruvyl-6-hydroxy-3-cyclohexene-1-carboxylate synthase